MPSPFWDAEEFRPTGTGNELNNELDRDGHSAWNSTFLNEDIFSLLWSTASINGNQLPGIVDADATPHLRVDRKVPKDSNQELISVTGYTPSDISLTVKIWTPGQWDALQKVIAKVWKGRLQDKGNAVTVDHQNLTWLGIEQMVITSISSLSDSGEGIKTMSIKGIEFVDVPSTPKVLKEQKKGRIAPPDQRSSKQFGALGGIEAGTGNTPAAKPGAGGEGARTS